MSAGTRPTITYCYNSTYPMARLQQIASIMIDLDRILPWYSGKAQAAVRETVIPTLREAANQGCWPKGSSRKIRALLNKQTPAIRWGEQNEGALRSIRVPSGRGRSSNDAIDGWYLAHAMQFGSFGLAPSNLELAQKLRPHAGDEQLAVLETAARWAADFAPVAELVALLDSARPRPVVVMKTLSPTVLANVGKAMGVALDSIVSPPIEYEWVEIEIAGKTHRMMQGKILWPDGTRHCLSRWSGSDTCHACGHVIRDRTNWVPLVADAAHPEHGQTKASLWVGRDCARKLFGCEVTGDAIYPERAPDAGGAS